LIWGDSKSVIIGDMASGVDRFMLAFRMSMLHVFLLTCSFLPAAVVLFSTIVA
jgi:hypothetical protein